MLGRDRTEYASFADEPKKGEAPKFDWGKLWGNVLAGLAVVAVVTLIAVAMVATMGAGAVVIAAVASTAAISGTAAVAKSDFRHPIYNLLVCMRLVESPHKMA
ncbi:hypothetical protein ACJ7K1_03450 [Paenibacillus elgii]